MAGSSSTKHLSNGQQDRQGFRIGKAKNKKRKGAATTSILNN
jgi:hypothetical protein